MRMIARHGFDGYHIGYKVQPGLMMEDGMSSDELDVYVTHESGGERHHGGVELKAGQHPETIALQVAGEIIKKLEQQPEK